ncbi:sulfurtransferase [Bacillaceae bacterium SIJ1]|uniref:sulfurtransferase n=1 Tax=Litoribacterium kuwaitense TaxID=1398745 RepID=UPI0013ED9E87|nr:sulfurtransferase [Litoribacterium kuwaitense]NGP44908.1 sulfurtransferase [Litoribacterium kuwaitense]
MSFIVDAAWLYGMLHDESEPLVIIDCRFSLQDAEAGRQAYERGHIPSAVYADLEKDLSTLASEHGGRHPLPSEQELAVTFGAMGVDSTKKVVVYDDGEGMMASRAWWILHYLGHPEVYVLNGGIEAWKAEGFDMTTEETVPEQRTFTPRPRHDELATMEDVRNQLTDTSSFLIDSRAPNRYLGIEEPLDPVAGHIPGAINVFWKGVQQDNSIHWKNKEALQAHFSKLPAHKEIIVYCGSGVSACPNVLALKEAGFTNIKLYAGSWSDWVSYANNPVATGQD